MPTGEPIAWMDWLWLAAGTVLTLFIAVMLVIWVRAEWRRVSLEEAAERATRLTDGTETDSPASGQQ